MPRLILACAAALATAATSSASQISSTTPRPVAHAIRAGQAPVIDGKLDDAAWAEAMPLSGFIQHEPFDGREATERTEVRILFDKQALYIGARLYDKEPDGIIRGETRRDLPLKDQDAFIVLLDTFRDRQNAFIFGTTPAAIEHDGQVVREGEGGFGGPAGSAPTVTGANENINWDGTWQVKAAVDDQGWSAEFRIPFSTLRYDSGRRQTWGLNFARYIRRKNEEDFWAPVPRQYTFFRVSLAGSVEGLEPPARRTLLVTPYLLGSLSREYLAGTGTDVSANAGFDAKLGLTQSLIADVTYHTDFAQVEVDQLQINLTRFNLFFPEKRPFFLENAGTFGFGTPESVDLFFSRRIGIDDSGRQVPIVGGGRVTGKVGGLTLGVLDVQTSQLPDLGSLHVPANNFSVGRVVYELPHRSRIGAILVSPLATDSTGDYNTVFGIDGKLGIGDAVSLDGYLAHSETPNTTKPAESFNLSGTYTTRQWEVGSAIRQVDEGFRPEVGFLERPTFRFWSFRLLRHLRTPWLSWFRETRPHITFRQFDDVTGNPQSRLVHIDSHFLFANGAFFEFPGLNFTREALKDTFEIAKGVRIPPGLYDHFEFVSNYNTNLSAAYSFSGSAHVGGFYSGRHYGGTLSFLARPNQRLNLGLDVSHDNVKLAQGRFTADLVGLRLAYAFTPRVYLQSLTQFDNQTESFSTNIRFSWLGAAGTGLFVVFTEGRTTGDPSGLVHRAFVVKLTRQLDLGR